MKVSNLQQQGSAPPPSLLPSLIHHPLNQPYTSSSAAPPCQSTRSLHIIISKSSFYFELDAKNDEHVMDLADEVSRSISEQELIASA
ncbi:hypothetical protein MKW98_015560 [Papaver atlanticum]|uniref:Uncharacterized protein n=1 Tax=Papaver atlanticum TaxID=357466 RepID=A0AAD4S4G8_9MAGN|nr:hypothetical protein MKW98_015560 [Papaver atlanticum]